MQEMVQLTMPVIQIPITEEEIELSAHKAKDLGSLNNSILNGGGNLAGFIGEYGVNKLFGGEILNTYQNDIFYQGYKIEVKTKQTTVVPRADYECSVCEKNLKQRCDVYVFGRVFKDYSTFWLMGMKKKEAFLKNARRLKKGQIDPLSSNNFRVREDCRNMHHYNLELPEYLIRRARRLGFNVIDLPYEVPKEEEGEESS